MAQTAFIVTGVFVACGEDAGSVFLQQGIVTVDIERTVSPADSQVDSPMRVLLEVVIYGEDVEAEFPCSSFTSLRFKLYTSECRRPVKQQNNKTSLTLSRYCLAAGHRSA